MDTGAPDLATKRLKLFARFCFGWSVLILLRLLQIQILDHHEYSRLAQIQQERQVEIQAPRGAILDCNGQPLAMSVAVESVCVNPLRIPDVAVATAILSKVLNLDGRELQRKLSAAVDVRRGFLWVKRKVTPEEVAKLRSYGFEWIEYRTESTRYYPKEGLAAHVLGGVDHEEKGNGGIEQALEKELRGQPGIMRTTADVRQHVFDSQIFTDPQPGANVTLTVDERIQYIADRELAVAVKEHGAATGSLVVMNPSNGHILALANYPTYNPNIPPSSKQDFEARKNLAVTAPFEPGSVFKVVTVSAGLDTGRVTPETMFFCGNGAFTLFRRVIHDAHPYGGLSVADILAKSSNIGAIKVALQVGSDKMYDFVRAFGFGTATGLPLPGESSGIVRKLQKWIPSSIGSVAMGHEISTTTVQLAQACSVVANGGMRVRPQLLLRKERPGYGTAPEADAAPVRVLKPETAAKMRVLMRGVVEHGTGRQARLNGYSAGGKTGSAQIYDYAARTYTHRYNGSFMGFAPAKNPAIVVVVTLNSTPSGSRGFGGVVAAPVFKRVATAALRLLNVPKDEIETEEGHVDNSVPEPDLADAESSEPPDVDPTGETPLQLASAAPFQGPELPPDMLPKGPRVPNFHGKTKRAVIAESSAIGVRVELAGAGIARTQDPPPGSILRPGERVRVRFDR